jgi:hypothetical protein
MPEDSWLVPKIPRLAGKVLFTMLFDLEAGCSRLQAIPADFLVALWLEFAEAVAANKEFRKCEACGSWFEVSSGVSRADRQSCSTACRVWKHRKMAKVRDKLKTGWSLEEIAQHLKTDLRTVQRWLEMRGRE